MRIIFPSQPFEPTSVEPAFADEFRAATQAGIPTELLNADLLEEGDFEKAARRLRASDDDELAIYHGWMMRADEYRALHGALARRRLALINDPNSTGTRITSRSRLTSFSSTPRSQCGPRASAPTITQQ
jgi:hypothetical protein